MKKYKNKIAAGIIAVIVLALVFWYGGNSPDLRGWIPEPQHNIAAIQDEITDKEKNKSVVEENKSQNQSETPKASAESIDITEQITENIRPLGEKITPSGKTNDSEEEYSENQETVINEISAKDLYKTEPLPSAAIPAEPENTAITDNKLTCTLSVRCDTILDNIEWLDSEKIDIVPKDGVIFAEKTVTFYEGESVFNLLVRELKQNKIHLEYERTPIYNSTYIEGIANLYEFDCGELSGWMYKVNGRFPGYGSSLYQLKGGDKVEWVYTCDLGKDVGGHYSAGNSN